MKSFISNNANLLGGLLFIVCGWGLAGIVLTWLDNRGLVPEVGEEPVTEAEAPTEQAVNTSFGDLMQRLREAEPNAPGEILEEVANFVLTADGLSAEEIEQFQTGHMDRLLELVTSTSDGAAPELLPNAVFSPFQPTPIDHAEGVYERKWQELVANMDIADEQLVRDIIIEWEQFNSELSQQGNSGLLSRDEYSASLLTVEELQSRLSPYLSREQLENVAKNEEMYWEFEIDRHAEIQSAYENSGYRNDVLVAVRSNDIEALQMLLQSGANVNFTTADGRRSPLNQAVRDGNTKVVEILLNAGANIEWRDTYNNTPIIDAATYGDVDMVRLLAIKGANLEHTEKGHTALSVAAMFNHTKIVRELLEWEADATSEGGRMALSYARDYGNKEIQRMLQDAGAR